MIERYYFCVEVFRQYDKYKVVADKDREGKTKEFDTIQAAIRYAHSLVSREEVRHAHDPIKGY